MIVYLQKVYAGEYPQQQYPRQPEKKESHWVRNGLLATGALVGTHFGAKAGLLGRHMQKFAGNMHTRVGNALNIGAMSKEGMRAAGEAQAKLNLGVTGRGNAAYTEAFKNANKDVSYVDYLKGQGIKNAGNLSEKQAKDKALGLFRGKQTAQAMKSDEVVQMKPSLVEEEKIRGIMDKTAAGKTNKYGITKDMNYDQAKEAYNVTLDARNKGFVEKTGNEFVGPQPQQFTPAQ